MRYAPGLLQSNHPEDIRRYLEEELRRIAVAANEQFDKDIVWDDLRFPASNLRPGSSAPDWVEFRDGIYLPGFDGGVTVEEAHFQAQMPHAWKEGSIISPHLHWSTITATTAAAVVWQLDYVFANISGTFATSATTLTATASCSATGVHHITEFGDITLSAGTLSSMLVGRIFRDPGATGDSFAHDALLLEFDIHFQMDSNGSVLEYTKVR